MFITGGIVASLVLAGCGLSGHVSATSSGNGTVQTRGQDSPHQSLSSSPSPTAVPSESSNKGTGSSASTSSSTPSISTMSITYSNSQTALIIKEGHLARFPYMSVPRKGFDSQFVGVKLYTTTPVYPKILPKKILTLTYNNFIVYESRSAKAFGTGGDHARTRVVHLTIPGSGSRTPILGTWTTDYGIQGSGMHSFLTFRMHGVYCEIMSNTLSETQVNTIAESFSET